MGEQHRAAGRARGRQNHVLREVLFPSGARNCQPRRHSPASTSSAYGARSLWAAASHEGMAAHPSLRSSCSAATKSCRQGTVTPSRICCMKRAWTAGHLSFRTPAPSTHAAQYAAGEVRSALRRPRPPLRAGRLATCYARTSSCEDVHPSNSQKLFQSEASWVRAYAATVRGGNTRRKWFARGTAQ